MRLGTLSLLAGSLLAGSAGHLQAQAKPVWLPLYKDEHVLFDLDSASWKRNADSTLSMRLRTTESVHAAPPKMFMVRVLDVNCANHTYRMNSQAPMRADSILRELPVRTEGWKTPISGWQEDVMVRAICERGKNNR
ncbi:MAG: hypothetical protein V4617_01170 [Gemmatimonadota bacterium]